MYQQIICNRFYGIKNERDSVVVGIVEKSKRLDFSTMLVYWSLVSLVRNSVVLAVCLLHIRIAHENSVLFWHKDADIPISFRRI
jgi:hypothetical protein